MEMSSAMMGCCSRCSSQSRGLHLRRTLPGLKFFGRPSVSITITTILTLLFLFLNFSPFFTPLVWEYGVIRGLQCWHRERLCVGHGSTYESMIRCLHA